MNNNPKTVEMKKQFDQKNKVNSKVHEVTTWLGNNCNTRIAQYLTKKRQTENEAGAGRLVPELLSKKFYMR